MEETYNFIFDEDKLDEDKKRTIEVHLLFCEDCRKEMILLERMLKVEKQLKERRAEFLERVGLTEEEFKAILNIKAESLLLEHREFFERFPYEMSMDLWIKIKREIRKKK